MSRLYGRAEHTLVGRRKASAYTFTATTTNWTETKALDHAPAPEEKGPRDRDVDLWACPVLADTLILTRLFGVGLLDDHSSQ